MLAREHISYELPALKTDDTVARVLSWMDEFSVLHLPVFDQGKYIGCVSEADLLDVVDPEATMNSLSARLIKVSAKQHVPIYEVVTLMDEYHLSVVPILDDEDRFLGTIGHREAIHAMVSTFNMNSDGAIFILEMNYVDYALSEIARIIESNDARVLSSSLSFHEDSRMVDVTVKVNTESLSGIIQTLERYEYNIKAYFQKGSDQDILQDRYDSLMRYLNT
jgi:predicted transcriptional regulator